MKRRTFITLLGGTAVVWPLRGARAAVGELPTVGFLGQSTPLGEDDRAVAFAQRLRELGSEASSRCIRAGRL
jgi:hypothetical protein